MSWARIWFRVGRCDGAGVVGVAAGGAFGVAATAMSAYEAVVGAALVATPHTGPAPVIVKPGVGGAGDGAASAAQSAASEIPWNLLWELLKVVVTAYLDFNAWVLMEDALFLEDPIGNLTAMINAFMTNPVNALFEWGPMIFALGYTVVEGGAPADALLGGTASALVAALPPSLVPVATAVANMAGVPIGAVAVGSVAPVSGGVVSQARLVSAVAPGGSPGSVLASDRGAGALGFAGTAGKGSVGQPAGLTVLADEFGDGVRVPMLPGSWGPDLVGVAGDGGLVSV